MLEDVLKEKKLILVCGSGGVGKTTLAASLAFQAAIKGKKSVVITIDPARRLATSLGLEDLSSEPKQIDSGLLQKSLGKKDLELYAMMLDTKRTFDRLVEKYAPNKETEAKILNNKLYQHLSDMIAGSQEYMAMEKLFEVVSANEYDVIVIDTPPTTHAIDFLEAPERMVNALSNSMIHLLLKPAIFMGKSGLKLVERGTQLLLKVFDRITGFAFLQEVSEFLFAFRGLLSGFQNRAAEVRKILMDEGTTFILAAACQSQSISEIELFKEKLQNLNLSLGGIIVNRVYPYYPISKNKKETHREELEKRVGKDLAKKMIVSFDRFMQIAKRDQECIETISQGDIKIAPIIVPLFESDVHDLEGLNRIGKYLI